MTSIQFPILRELDDLEKVLNHIHEEVASIRAARLRQGAYPDPSPISLIETDADGLAQKALAIYKGRRTRDAIFQGLDLFAEPAWDLLLDLYVASATGAAISVSSACIAAAVAPTTALRWIEILHRRGLVDRQPDWDDRRRSYLSLTERGRSLVAKAVARS